MKDKKAVIGSFVSMFISTFIVVLALLIFALFSGAFKGFVEESNLKIQGEAESGIGEVLQYSGNQYHQLTTIRYLNFGENKDIKKILEEVKYDSKT